MMGEEILGYHFRRVPDFNWGPHGQLCSLIKLIDILEFSDFLDLGLMEFLDFGFRVIVHRTDSKHLHHISINFLYVILMLFARGDSLQNFHHVPSELGNFME
jgi:hypothetical protein